MNDFVDPPLVLDWSAYDQYGLGDAYAQLPASGGGWGKAAAVCIGSRQCQRSAAGVMCPSFRVTGDDTHSTRHRAASLKAALNGELDLVGPELAQAMELCVACKGCKRECPNGVDLALLRAEYLAQRWRCERPPLRERLFARLPVLLPWLRPLRLLHRLPGVARLAQRWLGVAARRPLPRIAGRSFLDTAHHDAGKVDGREVLLLVDTFSNHLDPDIAAAAVTVLTAAGYRVHLARPPAGEAPLCCGRTAFSGGFVDAARREAQRTLAALTPYVARGVPVLGLEPSCLLMLRDEYLTLGLGEAALTLSKSAWLLEEFLAREADAKRLALPLGPQPGPVLVHGHCHQKAFGAMKAMRKVMALVPEAEVSFIESSCCGMAGSFGYEAEHYDTSLAMAELALLPALRAAPEAQLVANGTSCRQQIRDGAGREGRHLAQWLRDALAPPLP